MAPAARLTRSRMYRSSLKPDPAVEVDGVPLFHFDWS